MPVFTNDECDLIEKNSENFFEGLKKNLVVKLQAQIGYKLPSELDSVLTKLSSLISLLKKRNSAGSSRGETVIKEEHKIPEEYAPLIKRVILQQRRIVASKL